MRGFLVNKEALSSTSNPQVKEALSLREKRNRDHTKLFLIEGYREILRAYEGKISFLKIFICPELFLGTNEQALIHHLEARGAKVVSTTEKVFSKLSYRDRPDGLLAIANQMQYTFSHLEKHLQKKKSPLFVIAEAIEKPGNLGTILRTSDAAGADGVIIVDHCTDIYNPNVVRASVGTLFTLPVLEASSDETLHWLKQHHIPVLAAIPQAEALFYDIDMKEGIAILLGTEQFGLSPFWKTNADISVRIPMHGHADSLNVAQACTILLYEAVRQRR